MQTPEKNIYLNFTKSIVDGFEEFVASVEKHGNVLEDKELRYKLKLISKKLQTIFNKWENTPDRKYSNSTLAEVTHKEIENFDVPKKTDSWDDFDSMIASSVGDVTVTSKVTATEVSSSTSNKPEFSILDKITSSTFPEQKPEIVDSNVGRVTFQLTKKEAEIVRQFGVENVKKEWIVGSNGFYVEKSISGNWKCNPCKLDALSYANIISHASGKGHIKKLDNYNRETSATRQKIDSTFNSELSFLSDTELELMKKENGANIIVPFNGFYCNACRGSLNSKEAVKLHINGGKHRKNCES